MMKLVLQPLKIEWWFWAITLIFILSALLGWPSGFYLVALISAVQIVFYRIRLQSFVAFETQVRIVYFAFALVGLLRPFRYPIFILLLIGTFMVVAYNRCGIALVLKKMPWNKHHVSGIAKSS